MAGLYKAGADQEFLDADKDPSKKIIYRHRKWQQKAGLVVEKFDELIFVRIPFILATAPVKEMAGLVASEDCRPYFKKNKLFKVKGQVVQRLIKLEAAERINFEYDLIVRSLANTMLLQDVQENVKDKIIDRDAGPEGYDLITFNGLLHLFQDRVQQLKKRPERERENLAAAFQIVVEDILYAHGGLEADDLELFDGFTLGDKFDYDTMMLLVDQNLGYEWLEDAYPDGGMTGSNFWEKFFLHGPKDKCEELGLVFEHFFISILDKSHISEHYSSKYVLKIELVKAPNVRPGSISALTASAAAGADSPVFGPEEDDEVHRRSSKMGRPPQSFHVAISRCQSSMNIDLSARARLKMTFAHILTCKVFKLLMMDYKGFVGLATDDTDCGRLISQVTVRAPFLRPPLVQSEMVTTLPLPPLINRKVSTKEQADVIKKTKCMQFDKAQKKEYVASAQQDAILNAVETLVFHQQLGVDVHLLPVTDKGSKTQKLYTHLMCEGYKVTAFFDQPHIDDRAIAGACKRMLPKNFKLINSITTCADGVHAPKSANVLNDSAKVHDDDLVLTLIGDYRREIAWETKCKSQNMEFLVPAFRENCLKARSAFTEMSNMRWLSESYSVSILEWACHTLLVAARTVYGKEFGLYKEQLAAKGSSHTVQGIQYIAYDKEDMKKLEEKINKRMKPIVFKSSDRAAENPFEEKQDPAHKKELREELAKTIVVEKKDASGDVIMGGLSDEEIDASQEAIQRDILEQLLEADRHESDSEDADAKLTGHKEGSIVIHKKRTFQFVPNLFYFLVDRENWMRCLCWERVSKAPLFGHGFSICINHSNIEARGMQFRLPSIVMSELAGHQITCLSEPLAQLDDECPNLPAVLGQGFLDVIWAQLQVAMQNTSQRRRLFMYAPNDRLDRSIYSAVRDYTLDPKTQKRLKWLLGDHTKFCFDPAIWGMNLEEDQGIPQVYAVKLEEPNDQRQSLGGLGGMLGAPDPLGNRWIPRRTPKQWEIDIRRGYCHNELDEDRIGAVYRAYMREAWEYRLVKDLTKLLREDRLGKFSYDIGRAAGCRELSTRHLEVCGGSLTRSKQASNNTGYLAEHIPMKMAENMIPQFLPWFQLPDEDSASELDQGESDGAPAPPRGRIVKSSERLDGYKNSFSGLDGRQGYPDGCDPADFWLIKTMEELFPFVNPHQIDNYIRQGMEAILTLEGEERKEAREEFQRDAYETCKQFLDGSNMPSDNVMRAVIRDHVVVKKEGYRLKEEELKKLANKKYPIDHLPRMIVSELVLEQWSSHTISGNYDFRKQWDAGLLQTKLIRGIYERFSAINKPLVLRIGGGKQPSTLYAVVLQSWPTMNVTPQVLLKRVEMGPGIDPEAGVKYRMHRKRQKLEFVKPADNASSPVCGVGSSMLLGAGSPGADSPGFSSPEPTAGAGELIFREDRVIDDDREDEANMCCALPQGVGSWSLPIQTGAGLSQESRIKFWLGLSRGGACYLGWHEEEIQILDADWISTGGKKYTLIRVPTDAETWRTPLQCSMELGFGIRDKWIHDKQESSHLGTDVKELVVQLITENPRTLHRLNEDEPPPKWDLAEDQRQFRRHLATCDDTPEASPHYHKMMRRLSAGPAATDYRADPQDLSNRHWFHESDLRSEDPKTYPYCWMADCQADPRTGVPVGNPSVPEFPAEFRYPDSAKPDVELDPPTELMKPLGATKETLLPAAEQPAMEVASSSSAVAAPPKQQEPTLPFWCLGGPVPAAFKEKEPEAAAATKPAPKKLDVHADATDLSFVPNDEQKPPAEKASAAVVDKDLIADEFEEEGYKYTGDRKIPARLRINYPAPGGSPEMDKVLPAADPEKNSPADIRFLAQYVARVRLEGRQWTEILYTLYYGGRSAAKHRLLQRGFYLPEDADLLPKEKQVVTLTATCQELLIEARKLVADSFKFVARGGDKGDKKQPKKMGRKMKEAGPSNDEVDKSFLSIAMENPQAGERVAAARGATIKHSKALASGKEGLVDLEDRFAGLTVDEKKAKEQKEAEELKERTANLRKIYEVDGGEKEKKVMEAGKNAFPQDVDIICLAAEEMGKTHQLHCSSCKIKIGDFKYSYLTPEGPRMELTTDVEKKKIVRYIGQRCHLYKPTEPPHVQCMCGYWIGGYLYDDKEGTVQLEAKDHWKCCHVYMESKAREVVKPCLCELPMKHKTIKHIPEKDTFGGDARKTKNK